MVGKSERPSEARVRKKIREMLNSYGAAVWYAPYVATGYGKAGTPDFLCCVRGYFFAIEAKATAKKRATALQQYEMRQIEQANGVVLLVHDDNLEEIPKMVLALRKRASINENRGETND